MTGSHESPDLVGLFTTYTASEESIGTRLARTVAAERAEDPLLLATSTDLALYPGGGKPPETLGIRFATRGFKELAAVSHLAPALSTLAALKERDPDGAWRTETRRLLDRVRRSRAANSAALWRDEIAVSAFRGREKSIARMIDYACEVTGDCLERVLDDPDHLDARVLRERYFDGGLPVPLNRVMIATFFLVSMDIAHRMIHWCDERELDWSRAMVLVAGQQGRPTAGVTWRTNSVAGTLLSASRGALPLDRLYVAPHAPVFADSGDLDGVAALEPALRILWAGTRSTVELGEAMFAGHPAFSAADLDRPEVGPATGTVGDLPRVRSADDWFSLITRMRVVLEDPRQLLSGAVSDIAAEQLVAHGNDPGAVSVPGLDGETYPADHPQ